MEINIAALHEEITAELRAAELRAAELRGQLAMLVRLAQTAQRPIMTEGEEAPTNGHEHHTGPLV